MSIYICLKRIHRGLLRKIIVHVMTLWSLSAIQSMDVVKLEDNRGSCLNYTFILIYHIRGETLHQVLERILLQLVKKFYLKTVKKQMIY